MTRDELLLNLNLQKILFDQPKYKPIANMIEKELEAYLEQVKEERAAEIEAEKKAAREETAESAASPEDDIETEPNPRRNPPQPANVGRRA